MSEKENRKRLLAWRILESLFDSSLEEEFEIYRGAVKTWLVGRKGAGVRVGTGMKDGSRVDCGVDCGVDEGLFDEVWGNCGGIGGFRRVVELLRPVKEVKEVERKFKGMSIKVDGDSGPARVGKGGSGVDYVSSDDERRVMDNVPGSSSEILPCSPQGGSGVRRGVDSVSSGILPCSPQGGKGGKGDCRVDSVSPGSTSGILPCSPQGGSGVRRGGMETVEEMRARWEKVERDVGEWMKQTRRV